MSVALALLVSALLYQPVQASAVSPSFNGPRLLPISVTTTTFSANALSGALRGYDAGLPFSRSRTRFSRPVLAAKAGAGAAGRWTPREVAGRRVYQRDDLIDPMRTNARGETNLSLMQRGRAPIGPDGRPIQLHHTIQREPGPVAEVTETLHQTRARQLHINPSNQLPSGVDRAAFGRWRTDYWTRRAGDFG